MCKKSIGLIKITFSCVLFSLVCNVQISSQSFQFPTDNNRYISLDIMKPNFDGGAGIKMLSSVWFLGSQIPTGDGKMVFRAEVPFVYYDDDGYYLPFVGNIDNDPEFIIGNILASIETRSSAIGGYGTFGIRLPMVGNKNFFAPGYGAFTDLDRLDAFLPNTVSLSLGGGTRKKLTSNLTQNIGFSSMVLIPIDEGPETEIYVKYFAKYLLENEKVNFHFGLTGIAIISESDYSLAERTEHQLSIGLQAKFGRITPGAFARIPIAEDLNILIDFVGGVNLTYVLGN